MVLEIKISGTSLQMVLEIEISGTLSANGISRYQWNPFANGILGY
jgi:hypothetical protein